MGNFKGLKRKERLFSGRFKDFGGKISGFYQEGEKRHGAEGMECGVWVRGHGVEGNRQ